MANKPAKLQKVGRPSKLTEQMIVDAAIKLGLESFTISQIADRLGTGISAIYRVLSTREQIVQRAALFLISRHERPVDMGQPWWEYIESFAAYLFDVLTENQLRATYFLKGSVGAMIQFEAGERNYRSLMDRGFSAEAAVVVFQGMTMIVGGAAFTQIHMETARQNGQSHEREALDLKSDPRWADRPQMCELIEYFADEHLHVDWRTTLRAYLRGVALGRGEYLPDSDSGAPSHDQRQ